jgi:hypothetical protein
MASIFGLTATDLANATSNDTLLACTDDSTPTSPGGTGTPNPTIIAALIDRAEQEVMSWLVTELGPPPLSSVLMAQLAADPFLKYAALEYAVALMYDRHPEYTRTGTDRSERMKRADQRMERVLDARQRPPTVPQPPANVGGTVVDNGPRIYIDSANGTKNAGDY